MSTSAAMLANGEPLPATVAIAGDHFLIDGEPTYKGRFWKGRRIEGLLMNTRMVQGIFDDLNPETRFRWAYPDTRRWDPERNTNEFVAAMPEWRRHGVLSFTINLQGGSPQGYSKEQPWENSAIAPDGSLRAGYMARLARILDKARELRMAPVLGIFYFGQDQHVRDEAAVKRAVENTIGWIFDRGYQNILIEIDNECDVKSYDHPILRPDRVHELIDLAKGMTHRGRHLLVSASFAGGAIPTANVVRTADFILMHGNGVENPDRIAHMVEQVRRVAGYRPMPVLFNEDDHFRFDQPVNNMTRAIGSYASWGYFDPGSSNYHDGYQCPPVNWTINTDRKKAFFGLVKEITGS